MRHFGRGIALLFFFIGWSASVAQVKEGDDFSWENFVEKCLVNVVEDENSEAMLPLYEELEMLHRHPLDVNAVGREDLLRLPFFTQEKADSLLAYRARKGRLTTLGELMFLPVFSYTDREVLPLFLFCGERVEEKASRREQWFGGRYEVETRTDIPFYTRAGYRKENAAKGYVGNGWYNVWRVRYDWHGRVAYGATLEKDAGERFPFYDYVSAYATYRTERWQWLLGDYKVHFGRGLLLGTNSFGNKLWMLAGAQPTAFRPHKSVNEVDFFRGVAVAFERKRWWLGAFASHRELDASLWNPDTVRTLQRTGYHRTALERERKGVVGNLTGGLRAEYSRRRWAVGLTAYGTYFAKPIKPTEALYTTYYLRGKTAAGLAVDFRLSGRQFLWMGEGALDKGRQLAFTTAFRYLPARDVALTFQLRGFSKAFVAPFGNTVAEASQLCNEQGALFGFDYAFSRRWKLTGYADFFRRPAPAYQVSRPSQGMEVCLQMTYAPAQHNVWGLSYYFKAKQHDVAGHPAVLEYRNRHRLKVQWSYSVSKWAFYPTVAGTFFKKQTAKAAWGGMCALRSRWIPTPKLRLDGFVGVFLTDDYASAVYVYEPLLPNASAFSSFYYHGYRLSAVVRWQMAKRWEAGLRFGQIRYFNRSAIGTGMQRIDASWKNDLSVQLRWRM